MTYTTDDIAQWISKGYEAYNPQDKPLKELPVIYGFNNGGSNQWYHAQLLAEDGTALGSHICSHEAFMTGDLGILEGSRPDRHEGFREHYPEGYRMDFIHGSNPFDNKFLAAAYKKNQQQREDDE